MKKEYKGITYEFIDSLKVKHLKALMRLGKGEIDPIENDAVLDYMIHNFILVPKIEDVDEMDADVLVFIMEELEILQEPMMKFDVIKKKLQK